MRAHATVPMTASDPAGIFMFGVLTKEYFPPRPCHQLQRPQHEVATRRYLRITGGPRYHPAPEGFSVGTFWGPQHLETDGSDSSYGVARHSLGGNIFLKVVFFLPSEGPDFSRPWQRIGGM